VGLLGVVGWLLPTLIGFVLTLTQSTGGLLALLLSFAVIVFTALDSKARNLVSYMYKSVMRWITGLFVEINPMAILKAYVSDLRSNLKKMRKQIGKMRVQMHKLMEMMVNNQKNIKANMDLASKAKASNENAQVILKTRKAGRLKESNMKLGDLYKRMEVLYRVLNKMYDNSFILTEDIEDQIELKEQEHKAMMAGHSAMKSAMSIIKGDTDKRAMFDQALEAIADDVSGKVGEMERFMEMSEEFMASIDLQNGIFEDKGMEMLEKWEKESTSLLLGESKEQLILDANNDNNVLDLNAPIKTPVQENRGNQYDNFFD
jgi:hypothetical protein